ncbi:hypothetical protein A1Z17_RS05740 [Acinetobacter baumannii]|nr:hypothetical protein [Acinetobacter baumannii]
MSGKTKFTKREWILSIIILLIIEAFIFWVAFQFAGNSSALGYVSFAGTLISIILAVLAIGYTYGESHQQKNSSITLGNQIESLVAIKDKLEIQAEALNDIKFLKSSLENFSEKVDNHFFETNDNLQKVKFDLQVFGKSSNDVNVFNDSELSVNTTNAIFYRLFILPNRTFVDLSLLLSVLYFENRSLFVNDRVRFVESIIGNDRAELNFGFNVGTFAAISLLLEQMNFLNFETGEINSLVLDRFNELVNTPYDNLKTQGEGLGQKVIDYALNSTYFKKI